MNQTAPQTSFDHLPCICAADQREGSYAIGCERHMAIELAKPPTAYVSTGFHTVTYFHAEVKVCTPVPHFDRDYGPGVASQESYLTCEHNHTSQAEAEACARRMARTVPGATLRSR